MARRDTPGVLRSGVDGDGEGVRKNVDGAEDSEGCGGADETGTKDANTVDA